MRKLLILIIISTLIVLFGCQEETPAPPTEQPKSETVKQDEAQVEKKQAEVSVSKDGLKIFIEPVEPVVVELPSEALPYWRDVSRETKPVLVLYSIHPLLEPIKDELKPAVADLMANGIADDFTLHGSQYRAEPLVLPSQSVSAAIDAGLFSEIIWVFPSTAMAEQMDLALFRKQVTEAGFLTEDEGNALNLNAGTYTGTVRGLPFRAVHPDAVSRIDKPMVLHVDLGFFKGVYQGEVKTRIYGILSDAIFSMQEAEWQPQLVTASYSTMEGTFSLDVRFLISAFADILRDPKLLSGALPESWALRSEALYAVNFFMESKVLEYYQQAVEKFPEDAATQYDMYRYLFFEKRQIDEALAHLDKAIALDRGYVAAYLELAQIANTDGNLPAALEMLDRAAPNASENPMVDLHRAQFILQTEQPQKALPLIERLKGLPWSEHYYPDTPKLLDEMEQAALEIQ